MISGMWNPEWENLTWKSYRLSTSPVRYSYVPWEIEKSHFQQYYSYILLIIFIISQKKQSVIHPPTPPENVTTLTCELWNFLIWLKVCCVLSDVGGSEKSQLWVVIGGSEENGLWCVATGMSGKQCHSKCSKWPLSALIHASSFFRTVQSHSTPRCAEIQRSAHVATSRCRKPQHVLLYRAPDAVLGLCR